MFGLNLTPLDHSDDVEWKYLIRFVIGIKADETLRIARLNGILITKPDDYCKIAQLDMKMAKSGRY